MAQSEIELTVKWENNVSFEITTKEDTDPVKILVKLEENGEIHTLWPAVKDLVERYVNALMARIGKEMESP